MKCPESVKLEKLEQAEKRSRMPIRGRLYLIRQSIPLTHRQYQQKAIFAKRLERVLRNKFEQYPIISCQRKA